MKGRLLHGETAAKVGFAAATAIVFALAWLAYRPGLTGTFLFDDWSNLRLLGEFGRIDNLESFKLYLLSGFAGPTGRPVAMLSFLLDARDWPADPQPFKQTNVLIHLMNGLVLFALLRLLARALGKPPATAAWAAMFAAAIWLLHPLWISTTLYAVQRMTQLSALFVLLGMALYVRARLRYGPVANAHLIAQSAAALGICGLLAVLSKENGALLAPLLLITEATILAAHDRRLKLQATRGFRIWRGVLLGLPTLAILLYFAANVLPSLLTGSAGIRDFTPGERLLTQGRVMWDYIWRLVLPTPHSGGLFNDQITVSTGFFSPLTTALAWTGWVIVVVLAWRNRQRYPAAALAVLFFLVGHSVESGFLQLELYFEHRNYLPAALLALPLALWWTDEQRLTVVTRTGIATVLVLTLSAMTAMGASLWGKPFQQALKWSQINPTSPRTHHHLAALWLETGNIGAATSHNQRVIALDPANIAARIQALSIACINGEDVDQKFKEVETVLQGTVLNGAVAQYQLGRLLDYLAAGGCPSIDLPEVFALVERLERQHVSGPQGLGALLNQRAAEALLRMERPAEAYQRFHRASQDTQPRGVLLRNVALLATHGSYEAALALLDTAWPDHVAPPTGFTIKRLRHLYTEGSGYYERERQALRLQIIADLDNPGR